MFNYSIICPILDELIDTSIYRVDRTSCQCLVYMLCHIIVLSSYTAVRSILPVRDIFTCSVTTDDVKQTVLLRNCFIHSGTPDQ